MAPSFCYIWKPKWKGVAAVNSPLCNFSKNELPKFTFCKCYLQSSFLNFSKFIRKHQQWRVKVLLLMKSVTIKNILLWIRKYLSGLVFYKIPLKGCFYNYNMIITADFKGTAFKWLLMHLQTIDQRCNDSQHSFKYCF